MATTPPSFSEAQLAWLKAQESPEMATQGLLPSETDHEQDTNGRPFK